MPHSELPWRLDDSDCEGAHNIFGPDALIAEVGRLDDAKLFMAAPDLLAALVKMRKTKYSETSEESVMADAAIAKATGK